MGWRLRTAVLAAAALAAAHVLAAIGLARGMPAPPWGDEAQFYREAAAEALRAVWLPWLPLSPDAHAPAELARGVVPLIALWLAGEALANLLRNPLRLLRVGRRGGHAVVLGLSPLARAMLARWAAVRRPALAVSPHEEDEAPALAAGAAFVLSDWHVEDMPERAGVARAGSLACVSGTDAENIDAAAGAARAAERLRAADAPPLVVFARVEDPFLRARIDERIDRLAALERVQLRVVSAAQIAARRVLREHPLSSYAVLRAAPHLWIFGCGSLGEELAVHAIRLATAAAARPALTLVDREAALRRGSFLLRWPGAPEAAALRFEQARAEEGEALHERLAAGAAPPSAAYFCFRREEDNLAAALALLGAFERRGLAVPPLYLRGRAPGAALGGHPWVRPLGDEGAIAEEFLMGERLDDAAKRLHERYLADALARGEQLGARRSLRPWLLLPEDLKDDNRNLADHIFAKVREAGCSLAPLEGAGTDPGWSDAEVELLSEREHIRWMTQRLLTGWKYAETRDDAQKLHPDMVPYAELDESRKELDRAAVRQIPTLLAEVGYALRRELRIGVLGPASPWAFTEGFERSLGAELERLWQLAAGRTVVLWIGLESAMACRLAEVALATGRARLAVVLAEPPQAWLGRQPPEVAERMLALLRSAERVLWVPPGAGEAAAVIAASSAMQWRLSIDGRDLDARASAWGMDAAGRVLSRPKEAT